MILPFDPITRSHEVESIVMQGLARAYYKFRYQPFYGGVCTANASGCCLLCIYCWNFQRNEYPLKRADERFIETSMVAEKLLGMYAKHSGSSMRVSGCEPFLGVDSTLHIAEVLEMVRKQGFNGQFIFETNGIMIGHNPDLLDLIKPFKPYIRLCIKADNQEDFERITGAQGSGYELQIKAANEIDARNIPCDVAIMPQFVEESEIVLRTPFVDIETEKLKYYVGTKKRLKARGIEISHKQFHKA
jgi:uncharacterized Fe-S cluster-containing radical SAM superfamily protein